jgi:hypothetical protein
VRAARAPNGETHGLMFLCEAAMGKMKEVRCWLCSGSVKALLRLCSGSVKALFRLCSGSVKALFRLCSGSVKALLRLC